MTQNLKDLKQLPDSATRADAEREADVSGQPVCWQGHKVSPDYRLGHTRHPELMWQRPLNGR